MKRFAWLILVTLTAAASAHPGVVQVNHHPCKVTLGVVIPTLAPPPAIRCRGLSDLRAVGGVPVEWVTYQESVSGAFVERIQAGRCKGTDVPSTSPFGAADLCRTGFLTCPSTGTVPFLFCLHMPQ